MSTTSSAIAEFEARVRAARRDRRRMVIRGGGSKSPTQPEQDAMLLDTTTHTGISILDTSEQVMRANAGTPIADLVAALADRQLVLGSEPPDYHGRATLGGTLAANLSGPARPWSGSIRDHVLGLELINGRGERLRFGGRVMKNVAGYDVSRLQAGALGRFGLITEVTLRVHPRPKASATCLLRCDAPTALEQMLALARKPLPITGACWEGGRLYVRASGNDKAVARAIRDIGGARLAGADEFWAGLGSPYHALFAGIRRPYRVSVRPNAPLANLPELLRIDWGGGLRWYDGESDAEALRSATRIASGRVTRFPASVSKNAAATNGALANIVERLRLAFDPDGVFAGA